MINIELSSIDNTVKTIPLQRLLSLFDMNAAIRVFPPYYKVRFLEKTKRAVRALQHASIDIEAETSIKAIDSNFYFGKIQLEKGTFFINEQDTSSITFMLLTRCQGNASIFTNKKVSIEKSYTVFYTLSKMHKNNVVHLDIKSKNLLHCNGDIRLADFDTLLNIDSINMDNTKEYTLEVADGYLGTRNYSPLSKGLATAECCTEKSELLVHFSRFISTYRKLYSKYDNTELDVTLDM